MKFLSAPLRPATLAVLLTLPWLLSAPPLQAQVVSDGTLGSAGRITGPTYQIPTLYGTIRGQNIFHSFSQFSIASGERAIFHGTNGTRFIIARVTGGEASAINGQLTTTPLGASLFLINPAGIAFGSGASLNLGGSFHASTASSLRLADGNLFTADPRMQGELSAAAPDSFIFNGPSGRISLEGSFLRVTERQSIGLHAGSILITQAGTQVAAMTALGGQISLTAIQGAGEIRLDGTQTSGTANGLLQILNGSLVTVSEGVQGLGGGRLVIRGGQVQVERSTLESRSRRGNGAGVTIEGTQSVALNSSSVISNTTGAGTAGDINITGRQINLDGSTLDGRCDTGCEANARGANIRLSAEEGLELRNGSKVLAVTRASGSAGNITAQARDITLDTGSGMDTSCDPGCGNGAAGALSVTASGTLSVRGTDAATSFLVANSLGAGNAGRVELRAGTLSLDGNVQVQSITQQAGSSPGILLDADFIRILNGAQVVTSTQGTGNAGNLTATARRSLLISGTRFIPSGGMIIPAGLLSDTSGRGDAGTIRITTPSLQILAGGEVSSSSLDGATGNGGTINIAATDEVIVDGTDATGRLRSGIVSNTFSSGAAGRINITTRNMELRNKGVAFSQTFSIGDAGAVSVSADRMSILSGGQLGSSSLSSGNGGTVELALSGDLIIRGFANEKGVVTGIFTSSAATGTGGNINLTARNVSLNDSASLYVSSDRSGSGGNLRLSASGNLTLAGNSEIRGASAGTGLAGNLDIQVGGLLTLNDSSINTSARFSDGGNINLRVAGPSTLTASRIETEVGNGVGNGGNLVFGSQSLLMRNAVISANAFGGAGGNIRIVSPLLIANAGSGITASSALGIDGTVQLDSPAIDLSALLSTPFQAYVDNTLVGNGSCLPRAAAAESRLALVASRKEAMRRLGPVAAPFNADVPTLPDSFATCVPQVSGTSGQP